MASDEKKATELDRLSKEVEQLIFDIKNKNNAMEENATKLNSMLLKLKDKNKRFKKIMLEYMRDYLIAYQNNDLQKAQEISKDLLAQSARDKRTKKALVWGIGITLCAIVLTLYIFAWIFIAPIIMTLTMLAPAGPGGIAIIAGSMWEMIRNIEAKHQQALEISTLLTTEFSPDKNPDIPPGNDSMETPNEESHPLTNIYPSLTDDPDEEAMRAFEQEINAPLVVAAPYSSAEPIIPEVSAQTNAHSYNLYPSAPPDDESANQSTRAVAYGCNGLFSISSHSPSGGPTPPQSHEIVYQCPPPGYEYRT